MTEVVPASGSNQEDKRLDFTKNVLSVYDNLQGLVPRAGIEPASTASETVVLSIGPTREK